MLSEFFVNFTLQGTQQWPEPQFLNRMLKQKTKKRLKATPHNSRRYGFQAAGSGGCGSGICSCQRCSDTDIQYYLRF